MDGDPAALETQRAAGQVFGIDHLQTLNLDDVTYGEIEIIDPQFAVDARAFEKALPLRQEAIKAAVVSHQWDGTDQALVSPAGRLQALADKLNAEAQTLEKARRRTKKFALRCRNSLTNLMLGSG